MGQLAYAKHRAARKLPGQTKRAVQEAISAGRIPVGPDGKIDPAVADKAWEETTSVGHRRGGGATNASRSRRVAALAPDPGDQEAAPAKPLAAPDGSAGGVSFAQASAIAQAYKARLMRLEYEERSGKLVSAETMLAEWQKAIVQSRNRILGVTAKIRTRMPHIVVEDVLGIEAMLREALEGLADGTDAK